MKSLLILFILIEIFISGCISKKRYIESLNEAKIQDSLLRDTLRQKDLMIKKLSSYIEDMSANGKIPAENFLPMIPNPPPQSTDYLPFDESKFAVFKSYGQIDSVLSSAISKIYKTKIYIPFKGGGFAIATPIVMINGKDAKRDIEFADENKLEGFFKYLFSQTHENELFFPDFDYSRCVIFIISPNLYSVGGKNVDGNEIQSWINASNFRLPEPIKKTPLPNHTQVVALLYEFETNKNLKGDLKILDKNHKLTSIEDMDLIKYLSKYKGQQ